MFRGVETEQLKLWENAAERSADDWQTIVGVQPERMNDRGIFRVLEWGGMEA